MIVKTLSEQHTVNCFIFPSVPIFVKWSKKTISSVRKFVILGLPEQSLSQGDLSYKSYVLVQLIDKCDSLFEFRIITHNYKQ